MILLGRGQQPTYRKGTALLGFWEVKTTLSCLGTGARLSVRDVAPEASPVPWEDGALLTVSHTSCPQSGVKAGGDLWGRWSLSPSHQGRPGTPSGCAS